MSGRNPTFEWQTAFIRAGYRGVNLAVGSWVNDKWNGKSNDHPLVPADTIAAETGYSIRSVRRAIARLAADGWMIQRFRGGRRGDVAWASRFQLVIPNVTSVSPNVTPVSSQRDMGVTPVDLDVDLYVDQTNLSLSNTSNVIPFRPLRGEDAKGSVVGQRLVSESGERYNPACTSAATCHDGQDCPWCPPIQESR